MPLMRCEKNGKPGWKWGNSGFCFTFNPKKKNAEQKAKRKALRQARAIRASGYKRNGIK